MDRGVEMTTAGRSRPAGDEALVQLIATTLKVGAVALSWTLTGYLVAVNTGLLGWLK